MVCNRTLDGLIYMLTQLLFVALDKNDAVYSPSTPVCQCWEDVFVEISHVCVCSFRRNAFPMNLAGICGNSPGKRKFPTGICN